MTTPSNTTQNTRNVSIDYLRTTLTLMVVAHHSSLAYTTFARFHASNYLASTHPVVDSSRWLFLDYAENFDDVFFMSLMFLVSGLFVWPSLQRHGIAAFLRERFLRLGLPFAVFVSALMPLAYYASWQLTGNDIGYLAYLRDSYFTHGWPPGPLWFIWVLLMFDYIAALLCAARFNLQKFDGIHPFAKERPVLVAVGMFVVCALLYLPILATFGSRWIAFLSRPFYFELPRIGLYFAWFAFGTLIGAAPLIRGLLSEEGAFTRNWRRWIAACFVAYNLLVFTPRVMGIANIMTPYGRGAVEAIL